MFELGFAFSSQSSGRPYSLNGYCDELLEADNSCVVLHGTEVIFASDTERFSHIKHDPSEPYVPLQHFKTYCDTGSIQKMCSSDANCKEACYVEGQPTDFRLRAPNNSSLFFRDFTQSKLQHNHHQNHIYEAFYQSGFKESAVLVNDRYGKGVNDGFCITLAYVEEGKEPQILKQFDKGVSPCNVYYEASRQIFGQKNAEGKLMGLAAYGQSNGQAYISWNNRSNSICVSENHLKEEILGSLKELHRNKNDMMEAKDVAFTVQKNFEDTMVEVVKNFKMLLEEGGIQTDNLCMSGGGVLNCPTNSRIVELGLFKHYFASPHTSDACAESIGRVFRNMQLNGKSLESKRLTSSYLGVSYPRNELICKCEKIDHSNESLSETLESGGVLAWFQGGAEYGPRALGHRSFLADPSHKTILDALNKIKGREWWRPLAPIVPEELFTRIFEVENTDMCEFMLRTLKVKEKWQSRLQAVCHVDGTTRPQLLKRDVNPQLYDLLVAYFEKTHTPCLVNTSLNINGFPIVETPRDFCHLIEEISFMDEVVKVRSVFVDDEGCFDVVRG